jgi:hypothetical protein
MERAPERIWIDRAVTDKRWHESKDDCTLSGIVSQGYVRDDLKGHDEFFFSAMDELKKLRDCLEQTEAKLSQADALIDAMQKDHASNNHRLAEAEHRAKVAGNHIHYHIPAGYKLVQKTETVHNVSYTTVTLQPVAKS